MLNLYDNWNLIFYEDVLFDIIACVPVTHPRAGEETHFKDWLVGALYYGATSRKIHTIRANFELWEKRFEDIYAGKACLSVRYWEGKPY